MGIKERLRRLEQVTIPPETPLVLIRGEREPRTKRPIIWVLTEAGKLATLAIIHGERT